MLYPEQSVSFCPTCSREIPARCFWRTSGKIITGSGKRISTVILNSFCPRCEAEYSTGLSGRMWYRWIYRQVWRWLYPQTESPLARLRALAEEQERRTVEAQLQFEEEAAARGRRILDLQLELEKPTQISPGWADDETFLDSISDRRAAG